MPPPKRMTANPARPARYHPGKVTRAESSNSDSDNSDQEEAPPPPVAAPAPLASSFPKKQASQISNNLKNVDLNAQRRAAAAAAAQKKQINEEEFETESEVGSAASGSESEEEESSGEEESSSEDEVAARRKLQRPVFIRKADREKQMNGATNSRSEEQRWAEEEAKRKARANELVQDQLEKNAAAKAAGKKFWDDEDNIADEVDDTDDLDPEAERAAWKLRELTRVKRERDALIAAEKEREEVERRRNLSKEERDAEDKEFLDAQQAERDGKGKISHLQKYHHKGAYYVEGLAESGLLKRDIMGGRYADDVVNKDVLPEYMQIRDMTKLGKKGRTRYKDMKSEDTGRWGEFGDRRKPGGGFGTDERFRPGYDGPGGGDGPSGANASALGERKRGADDYRGGEKRLRVD